MAALRIMAIVEGHGESQAVPVLIRRIAEEVAPDLPLQVLQPIRKARHRIVKESELERAVELAARRADAILILLDADDDCPAELGPALVARARSARADLPVSVVLAKMEFEAWFLAAAESLGLANGPADSSNPEGVRDAKGRLTQSGARWLCSPTLHQAPLTARMNLTEARRAPSFDQCYREIVRLLDSLRES